MKKLRYLLLALIICATLTACGGPDKQPAIDAHNRAVTAINELAAIINQNPEAYAAEDIATMNAMVETLDQVADALENRNDLDQDALNEWVKVCGEVEQWAIEVKAVLEN